MKNLIIALLAIVSSTVNIRAGESATPTSDNSKFYLCRDKKPTCRIIVPFGEDPGRNWQEAKLKLAQSLQSYINKLSGVVIPVEMPEARGTNDNIRNEIQLVTDERAVMLPYCYQVRAGQTSPQKAVLVIDGDGPDCAKQALEKFVETVFGPPLSAIDDPAYKWPQMPAVSFDLDKFQTLKHGR